MASEQVHDKFVAEAQFDSRDFDKNIRKSQKTLEDFKKSLNFEDAVGQMETLHQSSGILDGMAKNLKKLTTEFAGIGSISTYVQGKIKNAWQGAANSVENFAKSLTAVQRQAGAEKYDKLLKAVQTIKNATGDAEGYVYGVMEKLNQYTDQTSYDFADMAQNIGKFTTAGVRLEDAEKEMEGIANWAALAGQGINEAQRAMYNLSQAMSAGYLLKIDYKSIQNANMDIRKFREEALKAAAEVGTLIEKNGTYKTKKGGKEVNVENFVETLQFKWFDKATMEKVFTTFGDNTKGIGEEAYKAAQRCVTLKDAINAIKDMLSTGWMKSYQLVFGKLSEAMDLFSGLCDKASAALEDFVKARNGILEKWNVDGGRNSLWATLVGEIETPDGKTLFSGAYGLLDLLVDVTDMVKEAFRSFVRMFVREEQLAIYDSDPDYVFSYLGAGLATFTKNVQTFMGSIGDFLHEVPEGAIESRFDQIKHVIESIYAAIVLVVDVGRGILGFVGTILGQLTPAFDAVRGLIAYLTALFTGDVVDGVKENIIGNFFRNLAELLRPVTTVINIFVNVLAHAIAAIVGFIHQTGLLPALMQGLSAVVGLIGQAFSKLLASDLFKSFLGWLSSLAARIPSAVQKIKTFGETIANTVKNSKRLNLFWSGVKNVFSEKSLKGIWASIQGRFANLTSKFPTLLSDLQTRLSGIWKKIVEVLDQFFGTILGYFVGSAKADEAAESIDNAIVAILTPGSGSADSGAATAAASSLIDRIREAFNRVWEPVKNFVGTFFRETIPNFFKSDAVKTLGKFFEGTTLMGLLGGVTNLIKWLAIFRTGSGLVSAGKGIKKLGVGLKVFGKNLKNFNLVGAFKDMFNFTNVINSNNVDISKTFNWGKFGDNLLKTAVGIGIVVGAAIMLSNAVSKLTPEQLKNTGITLAALVGGLVAADILSGKLGGGGKGLLKLGLAVGVLVLVLKQLSGMNIVFREAGAKGLFDKWTPFAKGLLTLIGLILVIAKAGSIAGKAAAKGLFKMALAIEILVLVIKQLMGIAVFREVGATSVFDKWTPFTKSLLTVAGLLFTLGIAGRLAGDGAKGLLGLAVAVEIMVLIIKQLTKVAVFRNADGSLSAFSTACITLVGILAALTGASILISKFGKDGVKSLSKIVLAVAALSLVAAMISQLKPEQVLYGFGAATAILLAMGTFVLMASKVDAKQIKSVAGVFIGFALVVAAIAASIVVIKEFAVQQDTIITVMGGLVLILGTLSALIAQASKVKGTGVGALAVALGGLILLVASITGSLLLMQKKNIKWESLLVMMAGIAAIVAIMGIFLPKLAALNPGGTLVAVLAMAGVVAAIMGVIGLMSEWLLGKVGNSLSSISAQLKTTSGMLLDFFERMDLINEASVQHAQKIFDMLKDLVLSFSGFEAYDTSIQSLLTQLNRLGTGLDVLFLNESKYPDPENSIVFRNLNKLNEIGPSLAAFNIGSFPDQIFTLGVALGLFNSATSGITEEKPKALTLMEGLFEQADNISTFMGLPLSELAGKMSDLGGAMSLYAKGASEVTGVDQEGVISIGDAVGILNQIVGAMNAEGGLADFTIPETLPESGDLTDFGIKLASLANALGKFIDAANGYTLSTDNALTLLGCLSDISRDLTASNLSFVNAFPDAGITYSGLGTFALDIGKLGEALGSFITNTEGKNFDTGLDALDQLEKINSRLTSSNLAFVKAFTEAGISGVGANSPLSVFANDIGELGHALGSFAANLIMEDGKEANFTKALHALGFMTRLEERLGDLQRLGGVINTLVNGDTQTLGTLSGNIQEMGQALHDFSDKMAGIGENNTGFNYDAVMSGLDALNAIVDIVNVMTKLNPETHEAFDEMYFLNNLTTFVTGLNDAEQLSAYMNHSNGKSIAQNLAEFCKELSDAFDAVGTVNTDNIMNLVHMATGLKALTDIDPNSGFANLGKMISMGIAEGIRDGKSEIVNAVVEVVEAGITAGNEKADIGSPSKVFAEMGGFMMSGLVLGLTDSEQNVTGATEDVVRTIIGTMQKGLSLPMKIGTNLFNFDDINLNAEHVMTLMQQLQEGFFSSEETEPTITPILDLSNLTNAGERIRQYLGGGYGLDLSGVNARAQAASSYTGPTEVVVQNPVELSGVIGSIGNLQTDIINLQTAISNMKIYLNTGVLAGGVTDDVDNNLGRKSLYAARRN